MKSKNNITPEGYQVTQQTSNFIDALNGLDDAYNKIFAAYAEFYGPECADKRIEMDINPSYFALRSQLEQMMLSSITEHLTYERGTMKI